MLGQVCVPTRVNRPKDLHDENMQINRIKLLYLQSTTRIERGGQYISCSGNSMSKNFTVLEKFGFLFASRITELWKSQCLCRGILKGCSIYLNDMTTTLNVHPWLVHSQKLNSFQVSQTPEEDFKSESRKCETVRYFS